MANSIGRRGGSGTLPLIGWPDGKSSLAVSAEGCCGAATIGGFGLGGAGLFAASPIVEPMGGGAVAFGLGQTILLGAAAGGARLPDALAATCIGLTDGAGRAAAAGAAGGPDVAGIGCAAAILAAAAGIGGFGPAGTGATGDATAAGPCEGAGGTVIATG